jgi:hypothetical protein
MKTEGFRVQVSGEGNIRAETQNLIWGNIVKVSSTIRLDARG